MAEKLRFEFEFDDTGPSNLQYEFEGPPNQKAEVAIEAGVPSLYISKDACKVLAQIFAKLALGSHSMGFHLHLRQDFDFDKAEILRIVLVSPDAT
jgi:hypothetical protein